MTSHIIFSIIKQKNDEVTIMQITTNVGAKPKIPSLDNQDNTFQMTKQRPNLESPGTAKIQSQPLSTNPFVDPSELNVDQCLSKVRNGVSFSTTLRPNDFLRPIEIEPINWGNHLAPVSDFEWAIKWSKSTQVTSDELSLLPCNESQVLPNEDDNFGHIHTISTVIPSSDALDQSTQTDLDLDLMDLIAEFKSDHQSFDQHKLKQHVRLELAIPKIKSILNLKDTFNGLKTLIERGIEKNSSAKK